MSNWNQKFGPEIVIVRNDSTGIEVRAPDPENTCEYIRIVITDARAENDVTGEVLEGECELVYWDQGEWMNEDAMPAILCAIKSVGEGDSFEVVFGHRAFE